MQENGRLHPGETEREWQLQDPRNLMPELGMGQCHWGTKYGVILTLGSNFTPHIQKAGSQGNIPPGDRFPYSLGKTEQTREKATRVSHLGTTQGTVRHPLKPPKVKVTIRYCSKQSDTKKREKTNKQTKNEPRGKEKSIQGTERKNNFLNSILRQEYILFVPN